MKNVFTTAAIVLTVGVFVLVLGGCGDNKEQNTVPARQANGGKQYGGIFRVNEVGEMRGLDPTGINDVTSHHIAHQIYENLLDLDENLQLTPTLAERWEVSTDGLAYTYFLRKGVLFHDNECFPEGKGREMKASDVKFTYDRICDARAKPRGAEYFKGKVVGAEEYFMATQQVMNGGNPAIQGVSGFEIVDDYTFRIRLIKPFGPFEYYVALGMTYIYPPEAVKHYGENFFQHPVGTGPFYFSSWTPDRECILQQWSKYWGKDDKGNQLPFLDKIVFSFMKDEKSQLLEFRQGNLDECYRIPSEFFPEIVGENKKTKGEYAKFTLFAVPALSTQFYGMINTSKEFSDIRIRKAFSMAIDRERIIKYVLKGQAASPGHYGIVPPAMPGYGEVTPGYTFNPQQAQKLLAEAGFPQGKNFPAITLQLNNGGGRNLQIAEAIQSQIQENLGIKVQLKQVEFAKHLDEVDAGRASFYRLGWIADYPDPENFLNLLYGKLVPPNGGISPINTVRFQNESFDALFDKALFTTDRDERLALYKQAEKIAMEYAPMMIIFHDEDYRLVQPDIQDYRNNAMDRRVYKWIWKKPKSE